MKSIRFVLKALLALFIVLLSLSVGLVLTVAIWPSLIVNESVLRLAAGYAAKKGVKIEWDSFHVQIDSVSLLRKNFKFEFEGLCVRVKSPVAQGCAPKFVVGMGLDFARFKPKLTRLGPLETRDLSWKYLQGKDQIKGVINLLGDDTFDLVNTDPAQNRSVDFHLWGFADLPGQSKSSARAEIRGLINVGQDEADGQLNGVRTSYSLNLRYLKEKARVSLLARGFAKGFATGTRSQDRFYSRISGTARNLAEALPLITIRDCDLEVNQAGLPEEFNRTGRVRLHCPLRFKIPTPPESFGRLRIPTELGVIARAELETPQFPPSLDGVVTGELVAELEPVLTPLFEGQGEIRSQVEGVPSQPLESWKLDSHAALELKVRSFERLVRLLDQTVWMVPAPFHALQGQAGLKISWQFNLTEGRLPVTLTTRLYSKTQALDLDGKGDFGFEKTGDLFLPSLNFDLIFSKVRLELPRLNWGTPPQLIPDSRFYHSSEDIKKEEEKARTQKTDFHYKIALHTPADQPVKLVSNLSQGDIPVFFNVMLASAAPISGDVKIGKFPIEFFRRDARLEFFRLVLREPVAESRIEGTVVIKYTDYTLRVKVDNTIDKPQVGFASDPPIPENQIIAVLLFGHPLEELDPEQGESVGNTRAALADGALSLVSLYALASTPIQSVSYDPTTQTVSAKLRLGEGTSLNLGTGSGVTTVGLRKRLGGHWTIVTDVARTTNEGSVATAYLEWRHRY